MNLKNTVASLFIILTASREGHVSIVKYLVENGADINEKDNHDSSALHLGITYLFFN